MRSRILREGLEASGADYLKPTEILDKSLPYLLKNKVKGFEKDRICYGYSLLSQECSPFEPNY